MKLTRVILAVLAISLAIYSLITNEYGVLAYMQLLLGAMFAVWAINEFQEKRKTLAVIFLFESGFLLFVGIYVLLS